MSDTITVKEQTWTRTSELRWLGPGWGKQLQQKWVSDRGGVQWLPIQSFVPDHTYDGGRWYAPKPEAQ